MTEIGEFISNIWYWIKHLVKMNKIISTIVFTLIIFFVLSRFYKYKQGRKVFGGDYKVHPFILLVVVFFIVCLLLSTGFYFDFVSNPDFNSILI